MNSSMYTEIVMYHAKNKSYYGELDNPTYVERGYNPSCGDDLTLMIKVEKDIIKEAKYIGEGCAISKAAMSMLIENILGQDINRAKEITSAYLDMIKGQVAPQEIIGDLAVFETLKTMPARVKCGTIGAHCLRVMVEKE